MTPRIALPIVAFCAIALLAGCGSEAYDEAVAVDGGGETEMRSVELSGEAQEMAPAQPQGDMEERKLIRTGDVRLEVEDLDAALERLGGILEEADGTIAGSEVRTQRSGGRLARLTLRVPATAFESTMDAITGIGHVEVRSTSVADVTRQYVDLEIRLAVKEDAVARLRELLTNRAGSLNEVLAVERELSRAVSELEQMKGERRYLDQQVAQSTISLVLVEPNVTLESIRPPRIREAFRASLSSLSVATTALVYGVTFMLPWVLLALAVWWLVRRARRARRGRASRGRDGTA